MPPAACQPGFSRSIGFVSLWFLVLWLLLLGSVLAAQSAGKNPVTLAARAADDAAYGTERREAARQLLATPGDVALASAFDAIMTIVARRDRLEREIRETGRRVAPDVNDLPSVTIGRPPPQAYTRFRQERDLENLQKDFDEDESVLKAMRRGIRVRLANTPAEDATVAACAQRAAKIRDPEPRAAALRALGFFPTASARSVILAQAAASPPSVSKAAVRALGELAAAMAAAPNEDPFWPGAFAQLRRALTRTWKDRDASHRKYRALSVSYTKQLHKIGVKTAAQLKKLFRGARPKKLPDAVERKLAKCEKDRNQEAAALRDYETLIEAYQESLGRLFRGLSEAQRATIEPSLVAGLGKLSHQDASIRLVQLCARLHSDRMHDALLSGLAARAPEARLAVCDALARHRRARAVPILAERLKDVFWQVRLASIRALRAIGGKTGIDVLIAALFDADGLILHELNAALQGLTGQDFHTNGPLWRDWWAKNRDTYEGPPAKKQQKKKSTRRRLAIPGGGPKQAKKEPDEQDAGAVSFYGIRTRSKRVVFVLDVSGSMHGGMSGLGLLGVLAGTKTKDSERKINHARAQLRLSIVSLPPDAVFNVVTYGDQVKAWKKDPVQATTGNKTAAREWVEGIEADGQTNIFDAIARALGMTGRGKGARLQPSAPDTIYLLTDGHANRGAVIDSAEMLEEIARLNASRSVTIHTIALGSDADAAFMRRLAERFNGRFVHLKGKGARD